MRRDLGIMATKGRCSLIIILFLTYSSYVKGCQIEGLSNLWVDINILDTDRGTIFEGNTTNILNVISAEHTGDDLQNTPYFNISFENSLFTLELRDSFALYEEYETSQSMSVSVIFGCNDEGQTVNYIFIIDITDTNNNAPVFINEDIVYYLPSPLPAGYQISGCNSEIIVKDIDLTTQTIQFKIENNDAFEILVDENFSEIKQFAATLRTKSYIKSFEEPVVLNISATDVDQTNDPPLTTYTTITLESNSEAVSLEPTFSKAYYLASYSEADGLHVADEIVLEQGYGDDVVFTLSGVFSEYFTISNINISVYIELVSSFPIDTLGSTPQIILTLKADRTLGGGDKAAIIISFDDVAEVYEQSEFSKALYKGRLLNNTLVHDEIFLSNSNETELSIDGEFSENFLVSVSSSGTVEVTLVNPNFTSSLNKSYIALELYSKDARTVLLIDIEASDDSAKLPEVNFESETYVFEVDYSHTGLFGICKAFATNNEDVLYSIVTDIDAIQQRVGINSLGEIYLFATIETGVYDFIVSAVTLETQVSTSAEVHMIVNSVHQSNENLVLAPLIVIEIDEEQAYEGLIDFNHTDCYFELHNNWPEGNDWVYVESSVLNTKAIDREHTEISDMPVSQVQAEVIMNCEQLRTKRDLGNYDYGSFNWLLMKSIEYNPKRSIVNIIVNDINDNHPVFEGDNGMVIVGYPDSQILDIIQPRALIYMQASDADIGINAEVVYWTSSDLVAVSPTSGTVHAKKSVKNDDIVKIHATDQLGNGLTGSVDIKIKLLSEKNIAVVTIPNLFLDDENEILHNISEAMGYDVKSLHTSLSAETNHDSRQVAGSSTMLKLFLYGLSNGQPVTVDQLASDINNSAKLTTAIESSVSLRTYIDANYLKNRNRYILIAILVIGSSLLIGLLLYFVLKWCNCFNYQKLSEVTSHTSQTDWIDGKFANHPSATNTVELRRSQYRLQQIIETSSVDSEIVSIQIDKRLNDNRNEIVRNSLEKDIFEVSSFGKMDNAKNSDYTSDTNVVKESMTDEYPVRTVSFLYPLNERLDENVEGKLNKRRVSNSNPFYIQLKDKLKGELDSDTEPSTERRKSVVTFDENVKKILHFDDFIVSKENFKGSEFSRI